MYTNIENILSSSLDLFYEYINDNKLLDTIKNNANFSLRVIETNSIINKFIDSISSNKNITVTELVRKYCYYYYYLYIGYYYKNNNNIYIDNIIESSKKNADIYNIDLFYSISSNSKVIELYILQKKILKLLELDNIDTIYLTIIKNLDYYKDVNDYIENISISYFINNILTNDINSLIKSLIIKYVYTTDDKNKYIQNFLDTDTNYKLIKVVTLINKQSISLSNIKDFLYEANLNVNSSIEYFNYIKDSIIENKTIYDIEHYITFLFSKKFIVPISEDILRYHKDGLKYVAENSTKIKYIIDFVNKTKKLYDDKSVTFHDNMSIYYNEFEELKIIKNLKGLDQITDYKYLNELLYLRKYNYINFVDSVYEVINLNFTSPVLAVRYSNFIKKTEDILDTRIVNNNIRINIIGYIINFNNKDVDKFHITSLNKIDIPTTYLNPSEFVNNIINNKLDYNNKLFYRFFESKQNIINKLNYVINIKENDIKTEIKEIYDIYFNYKNNNLLRDISITKNIFEYEKIYNSYINDVVYDNNTKNFLFSIQKILHDKIISFYNNRPKYIRVDDNKIIPLHVSKKVSTCNLTRYTIETTNERSITMCYHKILLNKIFSIKDNSAQHREEYLNFVKQYLIETNEGAYLCKSCQEQLTIKKFNVDGTFVEELDIYLTVNEVIKNNLVDIEKYSLYKKTIIYIEKIITTISNKINLIYLFNHSKSKINRNIYISNIIDNILDVTKNMFNLIHDNNENNIKFYNFYGINKEATVLIPFNLSDDIFNFEKDKEYKIIQYNNIIIYIIYTIIINLSDGQILAFKQYNNTNIIIFDKIKYILFDKLYIKVSNVNKVNVLDFPILCYIIYYFSGVLVNEKIFLYDKTISKHNTTSSNSFLINIQKNIITTFFDLLNRKIEYYYKSPKRYTKDFTLIQQLLKLNDNPYVYTNIRIQFDKMFNIKDNKIVSKNEYINNYLINSFIRKEFPLYSNTIFSSSFQLKLSPYVATYKLTTLTNCKDGRFHSWNLIDDEIKCTYCDSVLDDIKDNGTPIKYINNNNISRDAIEYYTNESNIYNEQYKLSATENQTNYDNIHYYFKNFKVKWKLNILLYVDNFINNLEKSIGKRININNKEVELNYDVYTITHNYLGRQLPSVEKILSNKVEVNNIDFFNKEVLYYKDTKNLIYLYYDIISLKYLGYSKILNKSVIPMSTDIFIKKDFSLKNKILLLGFTSQYINLNIYNEVLDINQNNITNDNIHKNDIYKEIIIMRIFNLKSILRNFVIKLGYKYNIFNNFNFIMDNYTSIDIDTNIISYELYNNHINSYDIANKAIDAYLLYYLLHNLNKIFEMNKLIITVDILKYIDDMFTKYYIPNDINLKRFIYNINLDPPGSDTRLKTVGIYNELILDDDINIDENNEKLYDINEELNALDIDDYDANDDFDEQAEDVAEMYDR